MIMQLTVFLENSEGRLADLCRTLADANINMSALTIAETSDYGIVRIICDNVFRAVDEKRPNLATFRMYEEGNLNVTKYMSASDTIFDLQKRLILQIAENEDAVIIGRCGNWILQDEDVSMISVYIRAPLEDRIQRVMENSDLDEADAKRFIRKTDRRRSEYYYHNTKRHWSDFEHYDLILNSASLGEDSCVALLCDCYREIL